MGNEQIIIWLSESDSICEEVGPNRWTIQLRHQYCEYVVTITAHGAWFSFAADLIGDLYDSQREGFYSYILEYNSRLNGVHIALDEGRFILVRDDYSEDIAFDQGNLYRSLNIFHKAHESVYGNILQMAESLGVALCR
jgi:hypothetical protein